MSCCGKTTARLVARGVAGLTRTAVGALTGIGRVDDVTLQQRRDVCRGCEFATRNAALEQNASRGLTTLSRCTQCQCYIAAKTTLAREECPLQKWFRADQAVRAPSLT